MCKVEDVANYFLSKKSMSPKKLQKIVYYAYGWTLALLNEDIKALDNRLFNEPIEAWVHGPVVPELYQKYKNYGWQNIEKIDENQDELFSEDVKDVLSQVWEVYGGYTANELESISCNEFPWKKARDGLAPFESSSVKISDEDMCRFFNEQTNTSKEQCSEKVRAYDYQYDMYLDEFDDFTGEALS